MPTLKLPYRSVGICLSAVVLLACAQPSFDWSANLLPPPNLLNLSSRETPGSEATLRVIVQFKEPVTGNEASLLQALQAQTTGHLRFLSAVSADTHVYSRQLPPGMDAAQALQSLAAATVVKRVERDQAAKAH